MDFISKLKETVISVFPIVAVVLVLNFTIAPLGEALWPFLIGSLMLVAGLSLFLTGTEIGMVPVGQKLGSVLAHKKNLPLMLIVGFLIGFGVTFAEPDVNVLAKQVHAMNPGINAELFVLFIALGLGLFVDLGLLRSLKRVSLKWVFLVSYCCVFIVVAFAGQKMASISFDSSGATTGPLAVPFLLALGLGVSTSSQEGRDDSFGLTGVASVGPVLAVALMAALASAETGSAVPESHTSMTFNAVLLRQIKSTATGFGPLALIILIMQFVLLRFPRVKFRKICFGILYSFIGIVVFLTGAEYGFSGVGTYLGTHIARAYPWWVSALIALVFGAIVVLAEPAVWVLTDQIESVSAGRIRKSIVMIFLCVGVSLAVALAIVRIRFELSYLWFIYVGVGLALVLSFFSPPLFTGIAFDSGGVASGPMSTCFLLAFATGVSGSADMGFGLVGLIAISPLISIQILGILFSVKERKMKGSE